MFLNHLTELPRSKDNFCQEQASDEVSMRARQKGRKKLGSAVYTTGYHWAPAIFWPNPY